MSKQNDVQNAFARIASQLQQRTTTVTPYEQSFLGTTNNTPKAYQHTRDFSDVNAVQARQNAALDTRGIGEKVGNIPLRAAGAFGELFEQAGGAIVNGIGAANTIGIDSAAETAFIKYQDQKKNGEYSKELQQLQSNPFAAIGSGKYADIRGVQERIGFLQNRMQQNQLTPEENALLFNSDGSETYAKQRLNWSKGAEDYAEQITGNREKGIAGSLNARNWYNHEGENAYQGYKALNGTPQAQQDLLQRNARDAYDQGDYLGWVSNHAKAFGNSAVDTAKALAANPMYALEETAAMTPYLLGATAIPAVAVDAARIQNQSHDQFTDRELRTPTATESIGILGMTAAYTGANYAESLIARGALKNAGVAKSLGLKSNVATATEKSALGAVRNNAAVQAFGRLSGSVVGEGATEAVQQQIESNWGSLNNELDSSAMGEAAVMGGVIAGTLGSPSAIAQGAIGTGLQAKASMATKAMKKAVEANPEMDTTVPTEEFIKPESPKYNPEAATVRTSQEMAFARANTEEAPEVVAQQVEALKQQQEDILSTANKRIEDIDGVLEIFEDPEGNRQQIQQYREYLDNTAKANPEAVNHPDYIETNNAVTTAEAQLAQYDEAIANGLTADSFRAERAKLQDQLTNSIEVVNRDPTKEVQDVNPTTIESKILGNPSDLSAEDLRKASTNTKYSDADKETLRKMSEARVAYNKLQTIDKVTQDMLVGSSQSKAIPSYLEDMGQAITSGDTHLRNNTLRMIKAFDADHHSKADATSKAVALAKETKRPIQIYRTESGTWDINTGKHLTGKAKKDNGALEFIASSPKSMALAEAIIIEAESISATREAVEAMAGGTYDSSPLAKLRDYTNQTKEANTASAMQAEEGRQQEYEANAPTQQPINTPANPDEDMWAGYDETTVVEGSPDVEEFITNDVPVETKPKSVKLVKPKTEVKHQPKQTVSKPTKVEAKENTVKQAEEGVKTEFLNAVTEAETVVDTQEDVDNPTDAQVETVTEVEDKPTADTKALREVERAKPITERNLVIDGANKLTTPFNSLNLGNSFGSIKTALTNYANKFITDKKLGVAIPTITPAIASLTDLVIAMQPAKTGVVPGDAQYKNFAEFLTEQGQLPDEVVNAMAVASYSWIAENAGKMYMTKKEVAKSVFINADQVPMQTYEALYRMGTNKNYVAESLGRTIVDLLGYKFLKDVAAERKDKLAVSLGQLAVNQLTVAKVLEETVVGKEAVDKFRNAILSVNAKAEDISDNNFGQISFIRATQNSKGTEITGNAKKVIDSARATKNIVGKMFGVERHRKLFSNKPETISQATIDAIGTEVSSYQQDMINFANKQKWNISKDTYATKQTFDKDLFERMAGIVSESDLANAQVMERKSIIAKNDALKRELEIFDDAVAELEYTDLIQGTSFGLDRNFYLSQEVWKQQRSGMANALNPVASKVHRGLVNMKAHTTNLVLDDSIIGLKHGYYNESAFLNSDGEVTAFGEFMQAIALASEDLEPNGVTTTADKTDILNYAPQYAEWVFGDGASAVDAMISVINGKSISREQQELITDTVAKMGMNLQSLKALTNLARFKQAVDNGDSTFTSDISLEVDGVTNGPWFTQFLLNTISHDMAMAGGAYKESDGMTNVPAYKDNGNPDTYEQNGMAIENTWKQVMTDAKTPEEVEVMLAIGDLYPKLTERKGAKTVTTVINFGSGVKATVQGIVGDFFSSVIDKLRDADEAETADLIKTFNRLIELSPKTADKIVYTGVGKEFIFDDRQVAAITETISKPLTKTVKGFIAAKYAAYEQVRDSLTGQANFGYKVFNKLFESALEAKVDQLEDGHDLVEGISAEDTKALLKELRDVMPLNESAMVNRSSNKVEASIPVAKVTKSTSTKEYDNVSAKLKSRPYKYLSGDFKYATGKGGATHVVNSKVKAFKLLEPGVSGLPIFIHSSDAFIAHTMIGNYASMNVHDAFTTPIGKGRTQGKFANKTTLDMLMTTHVSKNFIDGMLKPIAGLVGKFEGLLTFDSNVAELKASLNELAYADGRIDYETLTDKSTAITASQLLPSMVEAAYNRDIAKLINLKDYDYINQYGLQGGEYNVTAKDKEVIQSEIDSLTKAMEAKIQEATEIAAKLDKALGYEATTPKLPKEMKVTTEPKVEVNEASDTVKVQPNALVQYLNNFKSVGDGKFNKDVLFGALTKVLNDNDILKTTNELVSGQIFGLVKDIIPSNINVITVPKTLSAAVQYNGQEYLAKGQPAWFESDYQGRPTVFMFEQADGKYQVDVLVHELLHAATAMALESKDPKAVAAKKGIQKVYDAYMERMKAKGELTGDTKYIAESKYPLDEFIATALTRADILAELQTIQIKGNPSSLKSAFKSFIRGVVSVLEAVAGKTLTNSEAKGLTGIEALVLGVTNLAQAYEASEQLDMLTDLKQLGAPANKATQSVMSMNTLEVLESLTGTGTKFDDKLSQVLTNVASKIFDRFDNSLFNSIGLSSDPKSVWMDALAKGITPAVNQAVAVGFALSDKERFAVEAIYESVKAVAGDRSLSLSYSELSKSFSNAKTKLKPKDFYKGDWSKATKIDKDAAQAKWDYIFRITKTGDHLARFASLALGSEQVNSLLGFSNREPRVKADNMYDYIIDALKAIAEHIGLWVIGAKQNSNMNTHVYDVLSSLAKVDLKHRGFVSSKIEAQITKFDTAIDNTVAKGKEKLAKAIKKSDLTNSKSTVVGITADTIESAANDRLWEDLNRSAKLMTENVKGRYGFLREMLEEIGEPSKFKNLIEKMMRQVKMSSQYKEGLSEATEKNLLDTFHTKELTKQMRTAVTTMLRADTQSLIGTYNNAQIARMYSNPTYLKQQIHKYEQTLKGLDNRHLVMQSRAKDLARYMLTGLGAKNNNLAKNAKLIAIGAGTNQKTALADLNPKVEEAIDILVSLYAIQFTDTDTKTTLVDLMDTELQHDVNGIDTALKFHKALSDEAKKQLFEENPLSATKGFLPDITNPNHEVRFATTAEEAKNLREQMFTEIKVLNPNSIVGGTTVRMFLSENAGQTRMISGVLEVFSQNRKGTAVDLGGKNAAVARTVMNNISELKSTNYDPYTNAEESAMIPTYDIEGNITGFTYEMAGGTRDALLQRNNDFSKLLGQYAATNYNKLNVPVYNAEVIDALVEHANKNYSRKPKTFITVSPTSNDPEIVKMWATLPKTTRDHIRSTTGKSALLVPKDVMLPVFGYQKYSVMDALDKAPGNRNMYEKVYIAVFKTLFGNNARVYGARTERGMQEAVSLAKNMIVIRNVRTLTMNILSNTFLLQAHGASLTDIVKNSVIALRAGMQYRKDSALLLSAQQRLAAGVGDADKLEQEVLRLQNAIANNPLIDFINEGMMPSIVDDVALKAQDDYSYQSALGRKLDKGISKIPKPIITAGKWLMVDPSTPLYEFLNNTTQLSDFTAKYALYNYYTKDAPANQKLNHDDAIKEASDNFINYDMPTSKGMQYLNDMGILMFTKYNLRIQKALFKLLEKRPARALIQALVMHHGTDIPFGIDPIVWNQMGLPFRDGALILPDALGEPIPIATLRTLF